eukprot:m.358986 g.358986  ORF g.358986 m.358986 type:complete len:349 (+) comp18358_c0_seq1:185-1231(+)
MAEQAASAPASGAAVAPAAAAAEGDNDTYYFDSYSHYEIHAEMLQDTVRTRAYQRAITENPHLFKDKIVLDVGCGTGILSIFASQAGAKHVYAVDCAGIIHQARQIAKDNGYEGKITFIQGKMEELELPVEKVDIIISEWMGYALLYESMLNSVLFARDKYLAEDGKMLPDIATIAICGIEDSVYRDSKLNYWDNVYGLNMSAMKPSVMREPIVDVVGARQPITDYCSFYTFDTHKVTVDELTYEKEFTLKCKYDEFMHALVLHFDIDFSVCHKRVWFSTCPTADYTHWKQTVFYLEQVLAVKEGEEVHGRIKCMPNAKNPRHMDFELYIKFDGENCQAEFTQKFYME